MNLPVSVLMNCYNGERYIGEAIGSVLAQTFGDYELVVWDNQSSDRSVAIAEEFGDPRVRVIHAPDHTDLAQARRNALGHLKGDWIAVLDVDDRWYPDKLAKQMALAEATPDAGFVYCGTEVVGENVADDHVFRRFQRGLPSGDIYRQLLRGNFISTAALLLNAERLRRIGGFSGRFPIMEDYYVTLNLARRHPVAAVDEVLCEYRVHGDNASLNAAAETFEDLHIVSAFFPEPNALGAALRIIGRHLRNCIRTGTRPRLGRISTALRSP